VAEFMDAVVNVLWMETMIFQGKEESAGRCADDVIFEKSDWTDCGQTSCSFAVLES
jgi:hypothetical protein